jgi:hypothetical protein
MWQSFVIIFSQHTEKVSHQRFATRAEAWDYANEQYGGTVMWWIGPSSEHPTHTYYQGRLLRTELVN